MRPFGCIRGPILGNEFNFESLVIVCRVSSASGPVMEITLARFQARLAPSGADRLPPSERHGDHPECESASSHIAAQGCRESPRGHAPRYSPRPAW